MEKVTMPCVINMKFDGTKESMDNKKYYLYGYIWNQDATEKVKNLNPQIYHNLFEFKIGKGWFIIDEEEKTFYFKNFFIYEYNFEPEPSCYSQNIIGEVQDKQLIMEEIKKAINDDDEFRERFKGYKFCLIYDIK